MKPIEGVEINEALRLAEEETRDSRVRRVANAIKDVTNKIESARIKVAKLESEIESAKKNLTKQEDLLARIRQGDWSAIPERVTDKDNTSSC